MEQKYYQLTGVDIRKQKLLWDERGKGYYGEFLVFCKLYGEIAGHGKILMNLNIPAQGNKTTEIDLLLIHETGLYVFEAKHYKGTIYGQSTDSNWTQYFRTVQNRVFKNPFLQNAYHIDALKRLFPELPIHSILVFTSSECDLRVQNLDPCVDVCRLNALNTVLNQRFGRSPQFLSMEEMDSIFGKLMVYSQMREPFVIDEKEASFMEWLQPFMNGLDAKKEELEQERKALESERKKARREKQCAWVLGGIVVLLCLFAVYLSYLGFQGDYEQKVAEVEQRIQKIDEIDNSYVDILNSIVVVSNISINELGDQSVSFSARIGLDNNLYGMALTEESKYIVMTKTGDIFEYDVFGGHLTYNLMANRIGKGIRAFGDLKEAQFLGVSKEDIIYIKLTGVELFRLDINRTVVESGLDLKLYSADNE